MSIRRKPRGNRKYVPRPVHAPMLIGAELTMRPLEQIIEQIARDGSVTVDQGGAAVFVAGDGCWYESAPAIEGLVWHLEMWCTRHGRTLPLHPLREFHAALRDMQAIDARLLAKLIEAMPAWRRSMSLADPDDQVDLLRQTQIKAALEACAA